MFLLAVLQTRSTAQNVHFLSSCRLDLAPLKEKRQLCTKNTEDHNSIRFAKHIAERQKEKRFLSDKRSACKHVKTFSSKMQ